MLTTRQVAERLGISVRTVRRYVRGGRLEGTPLGEYSTAPLMITDESVERFQVEREKRKTERSAE